MGTGYHAWLCLVAGGLVALGSGAPAGGAETDAGAGRVVSLSPVATEIVLGLGLAGRLVAVDAESARIPELGSRPLAEPATALGFSPDLVLVGSREILPRAAPPTVRVLEVAPHNFDDAWAAYRSIGAALGQEDAARMWVLERSRPLAEIGAASFGERRPRVMAVLGIEPLEIAGGHSFVTDVIELAGAESVSHGIEEPRLRWSDARLTRAAPELVLLVGPDPPTAEQLASVRARLGPAVPIRPLVIEPQRFWIRDALPVLERVRTWVVELLREDAAAPDPPIGGILRIPPRPATHQEIPMLGYATIGTNDMPRAEAFYDALLAEVGAKRLFGMDRIKFYGTSTDQAMIALCIPYDEKPQTPGNGNMLAIPGGSREGVDRLYAKAIELGATDEGPPGERLPVFYGAYVRDLDGNKLCFFDMKMG